MTARFLGELSVSPYPDGRTWYLDAALVYECADGTHITVPSGFETDFASVPRAFTAMFPRWDDYGLASVVHDWLYWIQTMQRPHADWLFREAMECCDVAQWKRQTLYSAVRAFGAFAWADNERIARSGYSRIHSAGQFYKEWDRG